MGDKPTPENHHTIHTPSVNWDQLLLPRWHWPYAELGYTNPNDIWESLHTKFNCIHFALQAPGAWHSDVCELAVSSQNKEEFESALLKRREERFNEIRASWEKTCSELGANRNVWKAPPTGPDRPSITFRMIQRYFSFDTMVGHFGNYIVNDPSALGFDGRDAQSARVPAESSTLSDSPPTEQPRTSQQPPLNTLPSVSHPASQNPSSPPHRPSPVQPRAPTPEKEPKRTRVTRVAKGPTSRNRIEKPPRKERQSKTQPNEGVRRSARLQAKARRGGG